MSLMLSVSGCRGVVGQTLTPEVAARFAGSFGGWLRERAGGRPVTVVIGRDGRAGGEMVRAAAVAGLTGAGCSVVDLGIAMTPTVAVMTDQVGRTVGQAGGEAGLVAGMVLTASHNPQQWNGLKCLLADGLATDPFGSAACAPPARFANEIIERFKAGKPGLAGWEHLGAVCPDDSGVEEHVDRVLAAMQEAGLSDDPSRLGEGLRIAVDSVNGSGILGARLLLEALGCEEILHLGVEDSGIFPHPPEPTRENLSLPGGLCDAVAEAEFDVGFAQDPDADRLALVDGSGRYVGEEYTLALGAMALLESAAIDGKTAVRAPVLATNLSTSRMLDDVAAKYGGRVVRTAVGEANVVEAMKREGALAGGEGNGGLIWPRVTFVRDSLSAMALTVWLLSERGGGAGEKRTLAGLVDGLPSYAIEKRKVDLASRADADVAVEKVAKGFGGKYKVDRQDGAWVDLADRRSWLHVRASNTEPIMRLIAEAPTAGEASALLDEAAGLIAG